MSAWGTQRARAALVFGVAAVLTLGGRVWADDLLVSKVAYTDGTGATGEMVFQGRATGAVLSGQLYAGADTLQVEGTIAADGSVSGTVRSADGIAVGTFAATMDAARAFQGSFAFDSAQGSWSAPAEQLPTPTS